MKLFSLITLASAYDSTTEDYTSASYTHTYPPNTTPPPVIYCGGTITKSQTIASPGYDEGRDYYRNLNCVWNIELGDDVIGFNIKRNFFDVENNPYCIYDYVEVAADGDSTAYCGSNDGYKVTGAWKKKTSNKSNARHENVVASGFPDSMFVEGGNAVITFSTDSSVELKGFELEIEAVKATRLQIISRHAQRIFDEISELKWAPRYENRLSKVLQQLEDSETGSSCYDGNFPTSSDDEGDEITVFDENDICKLNGQVNSAISSYARNYACDGRGKVYRQIIRSARKVKKFFHQKNLCDYFLP